MGKSVRRKRWIIAYVACHGDTMYLIRVRGSLEPMVYNNDTLGFTTKGVQIIPPGLKPGDFTPGYIDETIISSHTKTVWNANFSIGETGYTYYGHVPAKVNYDVTGKILTLYQGDEVLSEETINTGGKGYRIGGSSAHYQSK